MNMMAMRLVSAIMHKHVVGVDRSAKVSTALIVMAHSRVSVAPVLQEGRLVGLLTREIAIEKGNSDKEAWQVMLRPQLIEKSMTIDKAAQLLVRSKLSRLPVIDSMKNMNVVGTVTAASIAKELRHPVSQDA